MTIKRRVMTFTLLALLSMGNAFAIINGTIDTTNKAVGVVYGEDEYGYDAACSAVLVAPNWVLTVAHFAVEIPEGSFCNANDYGEPGAVFYAYSEVIVHPDYDPDTGENDLALVHLSAPVTGTTPMTLLGSQISLTVGTSVTYSGYGLTSVSDPGNTARRSCVNPISTINTSTFITSYDDCGPYQGDSGGPAIIVSGGTPYVVGIIAQGGYDITDPITCMMVSAYTTFIDSTIAGIIPEDLPPSAPLLISPMADAEGLSNPVTFSWQPSVDPEGSDVRYDLCISETPDFSDTEIIDVGWNSALLAASAALILAPFTRGKKGKRGRRGKTIGSILIVLLIVLALFISCGDAPPDTSDDPITYEKNDLLSGRTYYWKVIARDETGNGVESETRSFTTD